MGEWLQAKLYSRTGYPDLLDVDSAAKMCGVSAERLLQLAKTGFAPCAVIDETDYKFFAKDLMEWAKENLMKIQKAQPLDIKIISNEKPIHSRIPESIFPLSKKLNTLKLHLGACIYFLIKGTEVVYVGQSTNFHNRIAQHLSDKDFDGVFYMNLPEESLNDVEQALIWHLKPVYNRTSYGESHCGHFNEVLSEIGLTGESNG